MLALLLLSKNVYSATSYGYETASGITYLDSYKVFESSDLTVLSFTVCDSWSDAVAKRWNGNNATGPYEQVGETIYNIVDIYIQCEEYGSVNGGTSYLRSNYLAYDGGTYGKRANIVYGQCENESGSMIRLEFSAGTYNSQTLINVPTRTCMNSCMYVATFEAATSYMTITNENFTNFGCEVGPNGANSFVNCGAGAPILYSNIWTADGNSCADTQEETITQNAFNDPCENGPGEYDPSCINTGDLSITPSTPGMVLEGLIADNTVPNIGVIEDASGSEDGWSLLNSTLDNGTNIFNAGDTSINYSGDYVNEQNNYYDNSTTTGDTNVNVDMTPVVNAVNATKTEIQETNTILGRIESWFNDGVETLDTDGSSITTSTEYLDITNKLSTIGDGTYKPFGNGIASTFPSLTPTGECINFDMNWKDQNISLTNDLTCRAQSIITTSLDFLFFFLTWLFVYRTYTNSLLAIG